MLLSTLGALWIGIAAQAHEVMPTIADFTVEEGSLTLDLRMNVEAFVAGIDLDGMTDTNASDRSGRYDALRALPPENLHPVVEDWAPAFARAIGIEAGGALTLEPERIEIGPLGNTDLPRVTMLRLQGAVPVEARTLVLRWPDGAGDLVLRQQGVSEPYTGYLSGGEASPPVPLAGGAAAGGWETFLNYIPVGFAHILPKGMDHILFVLGLFFLSARLRPLVWQVSAFTLAHTVTLALGALGLVTVQPEIVEPLIAASIVFVAVENLFTDGLNRWRPVLIFGFGLLHGLGFASVLGAFGLPQAQFVPALIGFNIGVELGQLTVIALAYLAVGFWFGRRPWYRRVIAMPASAAIALIGAYWFVERVFI